MSFGIAPPAARCRDHHERELTGLPQQQTHLPRAPPRKAEHARQPGDDEAFHKEETRNADQNSERLAQQQRHIDLHADSHEEEPEQQIFERLKVGFDLVPEFGFREQQPREERAKRRGKSRLSAPRLPCRSRRGRRQR